MVIIVTCFKSIAITRIILYVSNNADYTTQPKNTIIAVDLKNIDWRANTKVTIL